MIERSLPSLISIDLDGTLVDSVPDLAWAVDQTMLAMGQAARGEPKVRDWVGNGVATLLRRALADGDENAVIEQSALDAARLHFDGFYRSHFATFSRVYEGVPESLTWLGEQGIALALITNKPIAFTGPVMEALSLAKYFRWTLGGDSLEKSKPDPEPLLHVAKQAAVPTSRCLHIGDSRTDVLAAKNAGFRSVAVSFGYNHGRPISESNPDAVIDHWRDLPSVLRA